MRAIRIWVIALLMLTVTAFAGCGGGQETQEPATETQTMEEPATTEEMTPDTAAMEEMPADTTAAMDTTGGE